MWFKIISIVIYCKYGLHLLEIYFLLILLPRINKKTCTESNRKVLWRLGRVLGTKILHNVWVIFQSSLSHTHTLTHKQTYKKYARAQQCIRSRLVPLSFSFVDFFETQDIQWHWQTPYPFTYLFLHPTLLVYILGNIVK